MIISNLVVGINNILNLSIAFLAVLYTVIYYYGRFKNRYKAFIPLYILSTQCLLLMAWIFNSGSLGPVSFIFISFLLITIGIVPVSQHKLWFAIVLLTYLIAFGIEIFYPELIKGYDNTHQRYGDIISTFFIAFAFAYFFIRVLKINYAIEHEKTLKQKQLIERQNAYLENSNLVKDRLFTVLAHDLRSPMSSLKAMIDVFEDEIKTNVEMSEIAMAIDKRLSYNLQLLDDLMLWSKSQLIGTKIEKSQFVFNNIIQDTFQQLQRNAEVKNITLINNIPDSARIYAEANSIRAVIRNLITNAIKFCKEGCKVVLDYKEEQATDIILVSDSGIGMKYDEVAKLFTQKHFSNEGTHHERGSGLGLLLVKDFIEQNGGTIDISSTPGYGTCISLKLPKRAESFSKQFTDSLT